MKRLKKELQKRGIANFILTIFYRLSIILLLFWLFVTILDFAFANSLYGDKILSDGNIVVVLYKIIDNFLMGYKF